MKVDIIYRCCGKESTPDTRRPIRPHWFNKLKCFKSVWDMTDKDPATFSLHVIYDGKDSALSEYIIAMRMSHDGFKRVDFGSYQSMDFQWEYADSLTGDWIYFVEDDYLHAPDAGRVFLEGTDRFGLLSLYDHLDRYHRTDDITYGHEWIELTHSCHWRTAESTCTTWATSRSVWGLIKQSAKERGPADRHFFQDLVGRGIRLWTPIPARSTHCFMGYMSPLVDWETVSDGIKL